MRSLAAKHAFYTAKESLVSLFDDIRKKVIDFAIFNSLLAAIFFLLLQVEYYEANRQKELEQMRKERASRDGRKSARRLNQREIWKFPDGTTSDIKVDDAEKQEINEMATLTKVSAQEVRN